MFYPTDGSCGGYRHGVWTAPSRCLTPVVSAGLVFYEKPRARVWWAFACPEHAEHLTAARPSSTATAPRSPAAALQHRWTGPNRSPSAKPPAT